MDRLGGSNLIKEMKMNKKTLSIFAVAMAGSVSLSACGGGSGSSGSKVNADGKGGTLTYLLKSTVEHLDPQRVYVGRDISNIGRLASRSLVQFPATEDKTAANKPVADLANDTGKMSDGGKQWSFTLKDGVKWEDGKDITCADLKYGVSRSFATDVITGGPNYALSYLDIPQKDGLPTYVGPYKKTGQADFDKAVSCNGKTITYKFNKAWPDFNLAIASLRAFDPIRQDKDQGDKSNFQVFSSGPYKLDGKWQSGKGGTFVRNDKYDPKTDGVRKALPDKIVFTEGLDRNALNQRMIANQKTDQQTVTDASIQPQYFAQVNDSMKDRYFTPTSPYVDYLLPNFKKMTNPKVREALTAATSQKQWIGAGGGEKAWDFAYSIVNPALVGYEKQSAFSNQDGDPAKAKQLLKEAGVQTPYPIKFTYQSTPTSDKQAAALQQAWNKSGFQVSLDPLKDKGKYYSVVQDPNYGSDVMWAGWGADWPSASTVLPALFDSRPNLTAKSNGQDYGNYKSDAFNKLVDQAASATSVDQAGEIYKKADAQLVQDKAYIPLEITKFNILVGSKVAGYINNPATSMLPDLGSIGLKQ